MFSFSCLVLFSSHVKLVKKNGELLWLKLPLREGSPLSAEEKSSLPRVSALEGGCCDEVEHLCQSLCEWLQTMACSGWERATSFGQGGSAGSAVMGILQKQF